MTMDWGRELMLRHRRLFVMMTDEPFRSSGYPLCGRGWQDILTRLCRRIEAALGEGEIFEFSQIRQRRGILGINWDAEASEGTEAKIGEAAHLAVARSACTCEVCGRAGSLHNNKGWLQTRCAEDPSSALCRSPAPISSNSN